MMNAFKFTAVCGATLLLAACASEPMGPTVRVMPQQGKPFDVFAQEQAYCKGYANDQIGGQADRANDTAVLEGLGGTILGAGLGAAVGGGHGAAIGAAGGAIAGTAVGANSSGNEQRGIQQQYNDAYEQCMASKGNHVRRPVAYQPPAQTTVIYQQPAPPPQTVIYTNQPPVYAAPPGYYEER